MSGVTRACGVMRRPRGYGVPDQPALQARAPPGGLVVTDHDALLQFVLLFVAGWVIYGIVTLVRALT